jgi:hypothetical protein
VAITTTITTLDLGIRFEIRGSLGGGVASARCEGDCDQPTEILRNALAMPAIMQPASEISPQAATLKPDEKYFRNLRNILDKLAARSMAPDFKEEHAIKGHR